MGISLKPPLEQEQNSIKFAQQNKIVEHNTNEFTWISNKLQNELNEQSEDELKKHFFNTLNDLDLIHKNLLSKTQCHDNSLSFNVSLE